VGSDRIVTLADFEPLARASMDAAAFDYVAGGSWDESSLADNVAAWRRRRFRPRVLVDVGSVSTASSLLRVPASMPVATAPMAVHGLAHPDGEAGTARGAAAAGVPFTLSTMSTCSIEDVAAAAPDGTRWFQLYTQPDPAESKRLVQRAAAVGYSALVLTVDLPRLGYRDRDRRSGFELPELGNFRDGPRPAHRPDLRDLPEDGFERLEVAERATLSWADLAEIRSWSDLPLVLKGILTADDARLAVEHGADAIVVSNHGARQLDRVPATADVLEEVVAAVAGRTEVWVDGGIRRGLDVVAALALGARGVLVGRPVMYALAVDGAAGVASALEIMREEVEIALALLGVTSPDLVRREHLWDGPAA
jgi:isopentenyl diphosphate isomerase/L-lactate dehydrogenase-like FMN-dependent dehydrogenase